VLDGTSSFPDADDDSDGSPLNFRDEFIQVCVENEELRGHIGELQGQLSRLMKAQVSSLTDELEMVQEEAQTLRNQSVAFEALRQENASLQRGLIAFRAGGNLADSLQLRGKELESILDGVDHSSTASDDREPEMDEELPQRLLDAERKCAQGSELLAAAQAENAALHRELDATRDGHCYYTEIALLTAERNELRADLVRMEAMKDCIADSLEEQVDYLQSTIEAISSERDELQVRVKEQERLIQAVERVAETDTGGGSITSVVGECLAIVRERQLENVRAHDELRTLHRQIHELEAENVKLMGIVGARAERRDSDDE
jgi:prefoldin subunit 5